MRRTRNDTEGWRKGDLGRYIEPSGVRPGSGFNYGDAGTNPAGCGAYTSDESGLTNKVPEETTAPASRDIFDAVEGQSSDSGNRAVRSRGQP
jgi:hypothetical protein